MTLHDLFSASVARWPDRIAVSDGHRRLTYQELDRAANRVANGLRRSGVVEETVVGLSVVRSVDLVVGLLGILKAGAGYLPLDPRYPADRLRSMAADAGCRVVLGDMPSGTSVPVSPLNSFDDQSDTAPVIAAGPDNVAYVIYTSGSTGRPKGVVVTHANVTRLFEVTEDEFGFGQDDVWTMFHSVAFDFSVWEIWGALLYGGRLVVVPYAVSRAPQEFFRLLMAERVTVLSQTPSAFRQLEWAAEAAGFPPTDLRLVVFGGEKLEVAGLRRWLERYGDATPRLVNMYGITETTVHVTIRPITAADLSSRHSTIGRPLADLRVHVLDAERCPVEPGEVGEMYVGGAGVSRGYLERPELTAERFVPDPFGPAGARLYRTGDLASLDPSGELVFQGRADDQVQVRGFRIEVGEIEAVALAHPQVREAAVLLREDTPGEQQLVCYWVGTDPDVDLRGFVTARLPDYMVPARFVPLAALPVTPNGKLDVGALPRAEPESGAVAGQESVVERIAAIWVARLRVAEVGTHDNFFALGGDSIVAVPLVADLRAAGIDVTMMDLFAHPTIAELAELAGGDTGADEVTDPSVDIPVEGFPAGVVAVYPASALQQGLIFETKMSRDPTLYHDLMSARVRGPLDVTALNQAVRRLVERHEILRTAFDPGSRREVVQLVHQAAETPVTTVPVETPESTPYETVRRWWRDQWQERFDLSRAPLFRVHVLEHDGQFDLAISAHHTILDGWSFATMVTELLVDYDRELRHVEPLVRALPPRYREFVALERQAVTDEARNFWLSQLDGYRPVGLDRPLDTHAGQETDPDVVVALPDDQVARLREMASALGTPLKSVFLAAHLVALGRVTDRKDVVTGLVVNGRPEVAGGDTTLGLFLNSVPVRLELDGRDWPELVRGVFDVEQALLPYRRFPLARIRRETGMVPFDVLFNYTTFHVLDELAGLTAIEVTGWWLSDRNNFPVTVETGQLSSSDQWELTVRVDRTRVAADIADRLATAIRAAVAECAAFFGSKGATDGE